MPVVGVPWVQPTDLSVDTITGIHLLLACTTASISVSSSSQIPAHGKFEVNQVSEAGEKYNPVHIVSNGYVKLPGGGGGG